MRITIQRLLLRGSLTVLFLATSGACVLAQEVVGAVGAVNPATTGRTSNHSVRDLHAGDSVFARDRIVTKKGGSAQLMFLDRSTLNVGENSDILIDEFVYKAGGHGAMSATLTKGMLRFVGGQISHDDGATIKTPVVTIGIRGGMGTIGYVKDAAEARTIPGVPADFHGGTIVVNSFGTLTVHNDVSNVVLSRPGFAIFIGGRGEPIGAPVRFELATAQRMMAKLTSKANQRGGAKTTPGAIVSALAATPAVAIPVTIPERPSINALDFTAVLSVAGSLVRNRAQAQQAIQQYKAILAAPVSSVASTPVSTTPVATTPVTTPVVTTPVSTPVVTTPVSTPVVTTSATTPVVTTPVSTPVVTTPVTTPVVTTPVTTPVVTTPVTTPVVTTPVTTPVVTAPVTTPVVTTPVIVISTPGVTVTLSPGTTPVVTTTPIGSTPGITITTGKGMDNGIGNGGVNNGKGNEGKGS